MSISDSALDLVVQVLPPPPLRAATRPLQRHLMLHTANRTALPGSHSCLLTQAAHYSESFAPVRRQRT